MSVLDTFKLDGKVALVTGGNRGMAAGLAEAGADVVNLSRGAEAGDIRTQVEALGRRFLHIQCKLVDASSDRLHGVVEHVVNHMGLFGYLG